MKSTQAVYRLWAEALFLSIILPIAGPLNAQSIVSSNFISEGPTGSNLPLSGASTGLATNQPGGSWIWGAGWNWSAPQVFATWNGTAFLNAAYLGEEDTALGISISSNGGYTKPSAINISSTLVLSGALANVRVGLGFWSAMPARADGGAASAFDNFTGLVLEETTGNLLLYSGGAYQSGPVNVLSSFSENVAYQLSYSIDTTTGALSNVIFEGSPISGFTSTAFTDSATAFSGALTGIQSRGYFTNFNVQAVPEPSSLLLFIVGGIGLFRLRSRPSSLS